MKTITRMTSDVHALLAKIAAAPAGAYEKREDISLKAIAENLDGIGVAFEQFKGDNDTRLAALERHAARPGSGFASGTAGGTPAGETPQFVSKDGRPILTLKHGDNIEARMRQAGLIAEPDEPDALADFLRAVAGQKARGELSRKALAAGTDASGGYALPSNVLGGILQGLSAASTVTLAGANMVMLDGVGDGAKSTTIAAIDALPTAGWRAENGAVVESAPTFRGIVVEPKSLAFILRVSRELLSDASNLSQALQVAIGQAFAQEIDRTALLGSGTAPEPRGLANVAGVNAVGNGTNGATLAAGYYKSLFAAYQAILDADAPAPTAAIMSHRSRVGSGGMVDTTGQPLQAPPLLAGLKMLSTSQIPNNLTTGTSNDCSQMFVGDFGRMALVFRESVSVQMARELFAANGQIAFVCHARVDVAITYPQAFAVVSGLRG